jgi:hypothetical protein
LLLVGGFQLLVSLVLFLAQGWAFLDALSRRPEVFVAAGKLNKPAWLIILGIALAAHLLMWASPFGLLNLAGAVACIVYIVDARPAMRALTRR